MNRALVRRRMRVRQAGPGFPRPHERYATRDRVLRGWCASLSESYAIRRWHASSRGVCGEVRDNLIGEFIDCEIGAVDLDIGASVGVSPLVHQLFDSRQGGFSSL